MSQTTQILQSIDSQFSEWLHCCASLGDTFHSMAVVALYGYLSVVLINELFGVTWLDHLQLEHMMASLHPQNKHPRFGKLVAVAGGADLHKSLAPGRWSGTKGGKLRSIARIMRSCCVQCARH